MRKGSFLCARVACIVVSGAIGGAALGAAPSYTLVGTYDLPAGATTFDVMPNGSVVALRGGEIFTQDGVNSGSFSLLGNVDPAIFDGPFGNFGASFVSISPDGSKLAIGDNNALDRVHFVDFTALGGDPFAISPTTFVENLPGFTGHWSDSQTLFVAGGVFGSPASVTRITAPTVTSLSTAVVVSNIAGSPGGVTTDGMFLYVGNGFADGTGSSTTGDVRAFALSSFVGVMPTPIDFELSGIAVAKALSASSLGFDHFGNLLIGGGDFQGEQGFVAAVDQAAISQALAGGPMAPDASEQHLTPAGLTDFYSVQFNEFTQELLVTSFGSSAVHRYAIPAPGAGVGLVMGGGLFAMRRRRVAA